MTPSGSEAPEDRPRATTATGAPQRERDHETRPKGPPPISDGLTAYKGCVLKVSFSQENAKPKGL